MDNQPPESAPRKEKPFPISPESARSALDDISQDSEQLFIRESEALENEDTELLNLVGSFIANESNDTNSFAEGVVWTRTLIKKHANLIGSPMPTLTREGGESFFHSAEEKLRKGESMEEHVGSQMEEIKESDPEMHRALQELSKYKANKHSFYKGVLTVYFPLKRMHEADELNANLNGFQEVTEPSETKHNSEEPFNPDTDISHDIQQAAIKKLREGLVKNGEHSMEEGALRSYATSIALLFPDEWQKLKDDYKTRIGHIDIPDSDQISFFRFYTEADTKSLFPELFPPETQFKSHDVIEKGVDKKMENMGFILMERDLTVPKHMEGYLDYLKAYKTLFPDKMPQERLDKLWEMHGIGEAIPSALHEQYRIFSNLMLLYPEKVNQSEVLTKAKEEEIERIKASIKEQEGKIDESEADYQERIKTSPSLYPHRFGVTTGLLRNYRELYLLTNNTSFNERGLIEVQKPDNLIPPQQ